MPDGERKLAEAGVPSRVIEMIGALTRGEDEDYDTFVRRVAATPARRVKRADIEDNSDPDRLARLPPEMRDRLREKYDRALQLLDERS